MKNLKKLNEKVADKLTKLIKPNEKFLRRIRVSICMTMFKGNGFS